MKIKLVFDTWRKKGLTQAEELTLSMDDFHSGSTFNGNITLDSWQEKELREAIEKGVQPVFWIS